MATQLVLFTSGDALETAIATMCADSLITSDPEDVTPTAETLVLFAKTAEVDLTKWCGRGFKNIKVFSYVGEELVRELDTGEAVSVFPPAKMYSNLALELGIDVASFLDHVLIKTIPGYSPIIHDTTLDGARSLFAAIVGLNQNFQSVCLDIISGRLETMELIKTGRIIRQHRNAIIFDALQTGIKVTKDIPLVPGGENHVHPDGGAGETYKANILYVEYTDFLLAELDYVKGILAGSPCDYLVTTKFVAGTGDTPAIKKCICLRLCQKAPVGACLVGEGVAHGEVTVVSKPCGDNFWN